MRTTRATPIPEGVHVAVDGEVLRALRRHRRDCPDCHLCEDCRMYNCEVAEEFVETHLTLVSANAEQDGGRP